MLSQPVTSRVCIISHYPRVYRNKTTANTLLRRSGGNCSCLVMAPLKQYLDTLDMLANCEILNLDIKGPFCLFQENMGPMNIIIKRNNRIIDIINSSSQAADFIPRE